MSKKNLARSTLEGGRRRGNRDDRRRSNGVVRHKARTLSKEILRHGDPEEAAYSRRIPVYKSFDDKLSPAFRWLESQVGRPWDKVQSELIRRFDTRTTAGRHILFCHLLPSVDPWPYTSRFHPVYVDRHGLLRRQAPRAFYRPHAPAPRLTAEVVDWLATRRIGESGSMLFWFVSTEHGAFRQERRLTDEEAERFHALPEGVRHQTSPCFREETA